MCVSCCTGLTAWPTAELGAWHDRHRARARLWDARQPKAGQEVACASVPEWLDWHPARPELAVLDRTGTLTVADARRAGKPLSKRKTDCEARAALAVLRAARRGAAETK